MEYRTMPHNIDAEQAVLASMIVDKDVIPELVATMSKDDFYKKEHQNIFETIANLYNDHKPVDAISVSDKLNNLDYIANITMMNSTSANAKYYAGIVKGKSIRRQYINKANEVIDMAFDGEYENVMDFRNDVLQKMDVEIKDRKKEESQIKNITYTVYQNIEKRYNRHTEEVTKKYYGLYWLDKQTGGAHNSELTILAARPSVGKTALALQIALNMADKGNQIALFNQEMDKEALDERFISNKAGVLMENIRYGKSLTDIEWKKIKEATAVIAEYNVNIYDNVFKLEEIRAVLRELKNKNQLDYAIIDYLQICDTSKKLVGENERVSYLSRQFKLMAKEFKVPILLLSQITRANEHDNRRPKLIDLRSSGSIEQDADNVLFLHDNNYGKYTDNDEYAGQKIELIIAKQRNGKRDIYKEIDFYKSTQRFCDTGG